MKKKIVSAVLAAIMLTASACGNGGASASSTVTVSPISISETPVSVSTSDKESEPAPQVEVIPEGMYRSELTNEIISKEIENQRPLAVMVDNESTALPHYETTKSDIVYEMVNSNINGRITRLMCIIKDWKNITEFGNVRSLRPTNVIIAPEYNAIVIHDGGPFWINDWLAMKNAKQHLNGGFARIDRGKAGFYEEYITINDYKGVGEYAGNSYKGLETKIKNAGYETEYNEFYLGKHFVFAEKEHANEDYSDAVTAKTVELPFPHNKSTLKYNEKTKTYDYYEYDKLYKDAIDDAVMSFKNLIIYEAKLEPYEPLSDGYMIYNAINSGEGYFITNGNAIPIQWSKANMEEITVFSKDGYPIYLNTGKTYIALVPSDSWNDVVMK